MNVGDKLQEIGFLLAKNGLITVLEKMTVPVMSPIEPYRVTSQKAAHDGGDWNVSGAQKKMHMIGHQCPCVASCLRLLQETGNPRNEIVTVLVIGKDPLPFNSSNNNVMQCARGVDASLARHEFQISRECELVNNETTSPCSLFT